MVGSPRMEPLNTFQPSKFPERSELVVTASTSESVWPAETDQFPGEMDDGLEIFGVSG